MKKIRKSTGVALAFLIYVSVTAAYLLPVSYTHLTLPTICSV